MLLDVVVSVWWYLHVLLKCSRLLGGSMLCVVKCGFVADLLDFSLMYGSAMGQSGHCQRMEVFGSLSVIVYTIGFFSRDLAWMHPCLVVRPEALVFASASADSASSRG